jgi:hypothetical protein
MIRLGGEGHGQPGPGIKIGEIWAAGPAGTGSFRERGRDSTISRPFSD